MSWQASQGSSNAGEGPALAAAVLDMDGLMVDSERLSRQVWEEILGEHGYELEEAVYRRMVGRRTGESAQILLEAFPLPFLPAELADHKNERWRRVWLAGIPAMPGLEELQQALAEQNVPWAVATSSPKLYAQHLLDQLQLAPYCRAVAGGDEVQEGKPAPDIYLLAAERLGVAPEHCLALEDSEPGAHAAHAAGMTVVAVPNRITSYAEDFPFVDYVFPSLREVAANLSDLLAGRDNGE